MAADLPLHVFHIVPGRLRQVLRTPEMSHFQPGMAVMTGLASGSTAGKGNASVSCPFSSYRAQMGISSM